MTEQRKQSADPPAPARRRRASGRPAAADTVGRDLILQTAVEALKQTPPEQITMTRIAAQAGVTRQLVRYYFADADGLLRAVTQLLMHQLQEKMAVRAAAGDLRGRIRERLQLRLEFMLEHPHFERLAAKTIYFPPDDESVRLEQTLSRGMALTGMLLSDWSESAVDIRHVHLAIISVSAFLETGRPALELLLGKGAQGEAELSRYLDYAASMIAASIQTAARSQE
jgi:AcrR family transcriptional regulator